MRPDQTEKVCGGDVEECGSVEQWHTVDQCDQWTSAEQWHNEHGPCGVFNTSVIKGSIVCDGTSSVTRTLVYENHSRRTQHSESKRSVDKSFTQQLIQEILS